MENIFNRLSASDTDGRSAGTEEPYQKVADAFQNLVWFQTPLG